MVAQAGAGDGLVEDLDDLGAEAAGEHPLPAGRVLPGDPALLVRGGAEGEVGLAEQPVEGDGAVPGGVDAGQAGPHRAVDADRAAGAQAGPGGDSQAGLRAYPDHDQDHVSVRVSGLPAAVTASTRSRAGAQDGARLMALTAVPVSTVTPRASSSARTRAPRLGSTVGSTSGSCSTWVTFMPRAVSASAISSPMYPAPTITALAGDWSSRVRMTAKVSSIECSRCTPSAGPSRPGRRSAGGRARRRCR